MGDKSTDVTRTVKTRSAKEIKQALALCSVDRRTTLHRELQDIRTELVADFGGPEKCSNAELSMLDLIAKETLYLMLVDNFIMATGSVLDRRHRRTHGILADRTRLANALSQHMQALGIKHGRVK